MNCGLYYKIYAINKARLGRAVPPARRWTQGQAIEQSLDRGKDIPAQVSNNPQSGGEIVAKRDAIFKAYLWVFSPVLTGY
jgi:hypothetical protein